MTQTIMAEPVARPRRRRFIFPAILLVVIAAVFLIQPIGSWLDIEPEMLVNVISIAYMAVPLSLLLLLVWFLAFSGFRWYTRVLGLLFLVALAGTAVACIRNVEFSGDMKPMSISFRWQPDAEAEF